MSLLSRAVCFLHSPAAAHNQAIKVGVVETCAAIWVTSNFTETYSTTGVADAGLGRWAVTLSRDVSRIFVSTSQADTPRPLLPRRRENAARCNESMANKTWTLF
jgi:hypothetical protein